MAQNILNDLQGNSQPNDNNGNNKNNSSNNKFTYDNSAELEYLKSIDATLKELLHTGKNTSQSNAKNSMYSREDFRNPSKRKTGRSFYRGDAKSSFIDNFESAFLDGLIDSDFKKKIKASMNSLADMVGVELDEVPGAIGKALGQQAISKFKGTELGQKAFAGINKYANAAMNSIKTNFKAGVDKYAKEHPDYKPGDKGKKSATYAKEQSQKSTSNVTTAIPDNTLELNSSTLDSILTSVQSIENYLWSTSKERAEGRKARKEQEAATSQADDIAEEAPKPDEPNVPNKSELADNVDLDFGQDRFGDLIKNSKLGQTVTKIKDTALSGVDKIFGEGSASKFGSFLKSKGQGILGKIGLKSASSAAASNVGSSLVAAEAGGIGAGAAGATATAGAAGATASGAGAAAAGLTSVGTAAAGACPYILAAIAAVAIVVKTLQYFKSALDSAIEGTKKLVESALDPAIEGTKKLVESAKKSANRYQESRKKNLELEKQRLEADVETMIKAPFDILKEAAQKAYDVWDAQLRKINGTQGYNKSDLQNLMSAYAERLRSENLSSVIGSTDVTENLAKVLDSGLSGKVAEEFAYIATKLNAAIPTQDFFGYAEEYASVAANAIRKGESEAEAIAYANEQLELFASNILYASRQVSGGFSTGLKDAQSLFQESVKIAEASKTGNASQIAGVLTSVSAITGAIAPDLASSMTEAIVKAATGGNSSEIVALRSLAGVNASNTEFLKQLANDPQKIFTTLFKNLAKMQNMSNDAYMEVAEGLSSVFGISMDAFARIDFNYLADAIANMNVSNASLDENMKLLVSGQTTTTAEQLKLAQINQYMIDEGLSYVLDNQVARSIQEHMWDEQMKRELMEASYSVELKGSALEFLEGIRTTVQNIINFLNPFALIKKLGDLTATVAESKAQESDIKQLLELGKVGNGNILALKQLTTRNADLDVAPSIVNMMGGFSLYEAASSARQKFETTMDVLSSRLVLGPGVGTVVGLSTNTNFMNNLQGSIQSTVQKVLTSSFSNLGINSKYSWGSVSKSTYSAISQGNVARGSSVGSVSTPTTVSASSVSASVKKLEEMLDEDYINKFVENGQDYEDWAKSAKNKGISDLSAAIADAGYTEEAIKGRFQQAQSKYGAEKSADRLKQEDEFWKQGKDFWENTLQYESNVTQLMEMNNSWLEKIYKKSDQFYTSWIDYFVNHTAYNSAYKYSDVERIKSESKAQESGDIVNALAEALVKNTVDLKDPQVQTNALLSQILIVIQAIMNQNNKTGGLSLPDSLNALALGLVKQV